jgi:ricin-type beta-trefoil lectin protein
MKTNLRLRARHPWWMVASCLAAGLGMMSAFAGVARAQAAGTVRADDSQFKISPMTAVSAAKKRDALINFIWGSSGFPGSTLPQSHKLLCTSPSDCATKSPIANLPNLQSVEGIVIRLSQGTGNPMLIVAGYHLRPAAGATNRLVVMYQQHACYLDDGPGSGQIDQGTQRTIAALLAKGHSVLAMTMPHLTPADTALGVPRDCGGHPDSMFDFQVTGSPLKLFLEPLAQAINYLAQTASPKYQDFNMIGLSGGGWTTVVYSAIDPRIKISIPVAGSVPLYLRVEPYSHDKEQYLPAFYGALSPAVPGRAGYLDLYALGSFGTGRAQVQVLNRHDDCCFGEREHITDVLHVGFDTAVRAYEARLRSALGQLGSGLFRVVIDEASPIHMISDYTINSVIIPTLNGATSLDTTIRSVWGGNLCVDIPDVGRPPRNNDLLQVYTCHGGANQVFSLRSDSTIRTASGTLCVDVPDLGRPPQNGDRLQVYACNGGLNQKFNIMSDGTIQSQWGANLCFDIPSVGRPPQNQDPVQLYGCHGGINQQFSVNR